MADIMRDARQPRLIVTAFSGGVDSVALLDLVNNWLVHNHDADLPELVAVHLNHGLRGGEADGDAEFCRGWAQDLDIRFRSKKVDVQELARNEGLGLEEAGRLARHRFFAEIVGKRRALVLTGHHADDQAETILLHLRRGAHRRGLSGMRALTSIQVSPECRLSVGRPLLDVPKADILAYAAMRHLTWREDASNSDIRFERNNIRHRLIPDLEATLPGFRDRLLAKAKQLAVEEADLTGAGAELAGSLCRREENGVLFRLSADAFADPERLLYAFRHVLEEEMDGRLPYGAVLSRLAVLAETGRLGEGLTLPGRLQVRKEQDGLFFFLPGFFGKTNDMPPGEMEFILPDPPFEVRAGALLIKAEWRTLTGSPPDDDRVDPEVEWMNPEALVWPLRLRPPLPGERFRPLGAPGSRKLQDVMVDLKVPRRKRGEARVLADHAGAIWLWPYRLANRVRLVDGVLVKALRIGMSES